ncbi:MAG: XisI protein [Caldilinea sp. CFX5]|nr:XisI protein [Caldilinea sp. CFX5]
MDRKLDEYRALIKRVLQSYAELLKRHQKEGVETFLVFDDEREHYLLHTIGWADRKHVWNTALYVRLHNNKFYIEVDGTEHGIATDLLEAGVPPEDIVLAFHHPSVRPYTEFAVT